MKTRLRLPPAEAAALHLAFVDDVCRLSRGTAARRILALDGAPDARLRAIAAREGMELAAQGEGDLGARMDRALAAAVGDGQPAVIVGADVPTLPPARIALALALLERDEVVLGPAEDGGYYLVGARRPAPWLFAGVAWGTGEVLAQTLERLRLRGARHGLVGSHPDVDTPEDLAALRTRLLADGALAPATRRALGLGGGEPG